MFIHKQRNATFLAQLAVCAALSIASGPTLHSQDSAGVSKEAIKQSKSCWRGKPLPACNQFLLTEIGFYRRFLRPSAIVTVPTTGTGQSTPFSYELRPSKDFVSIEVGGMKNIGSRSALGGSVNFVKLDASGGVGAKVRYRRWLTPDGFAIDVGAGIESRPDEAFFGSSQHFGFTSEIAINASDYVSIVTRLDMIRIDGNSKPALSLGIRPGSKPALATAGGIAALYATVLAIFLFGGAGS